MNTRRFKHDDWTKIWEGAWSFLTCTHFIGQYTNELMFGRQPFQSQAIIFSAHGRSEGWMRQCDRDLLGNYLSKQIVRNSAFAKIVARRLTTQVKHFLAFIDKNENTVASMELYDEFWKRLLAYYHPHINVKYVVDYLHPDLLQRSLPALEHARLAAEPVFKRTEDFMRSFTRSLSKKTKYDARLLLCLTKHELQDYFTTKKLPLRSVLRARDKKSAIIGEKDSFQCYEGQSVAAIEKLVHVVQRQAFVKGSTAFPGKVRGTVRIILDPRQNKKFNQGDILVAGSTRPEFLPIMHKAAAFVTDAGGILSHAAITAREMKKPCVIGTKDATRVFKDGNRVEVDATKGVVKKIGH